MMRTHCWEFLLDKTSKKHDRRNMGLHHDDGFSAFKNKRSTQLKKIKKSLQKICKGFDLEIVTESYARIVNYLGATLNLQDGFLKLYLKPVEMIQYINKECNHPPNVIKQLPAFIGKRLSNHSSDEKNIQRICNLLRRSTKNAGYRNKFV